MATWNENLTNGIKSGYFNSEEVNGTYDRLYNAEDMTNYFEGLISNGIYAGIDDELKVSSAGSGTITVGTGRAMIDCRWIRVTQPQTLTLTAADTVANRNDLIVVKLDLRKNYRQMSIEVLENQYENFPTDTDEEKYLVLARVTVPANSTVLTIIDYRNTSHCGFVKSLATATPLYQTQTHTSFSQNTDGLDISNIAKNFVVGTDVLMVFKNGLKMIEGVDYTFDTSGTNPRVLFTHTAIAGSSMEYIVLKGSSESSEEAS